MKTSRSKATQKMLAMLLIFTLTFAIFTPFAAMADELTVPDVPPAPYVLINVDGVYLESDVPAFIFNNRTLIPIRAVSEMLDVEIGWCDDTRQVTISYGGFRAIITIGSYNVMIRGMHGGDHYEIVQLDIAAVIINNSTFVPLRCVAEFLDMDVDWNPAMRTVFITTPDNWPTKHTRGYYSLASDEHIQGLARSTTGSGDDILAGSPFLTNAGPPTFTIIESPFGGNAIRISNRSDNWHGIDVIIPAIGLGDGDYMITVRGSVTGGLLGIPVGTEVILGGARNPWTTFTSVVPAVDGTWEISMIINRELTAGISGQGAGELGQIRIATLNAPFSTFTVYSIEVLSAN